VLEKLLRENGGDVARVARQLGRQRTLVWRWLRKYGCEPALYRG
jgi:transposase-like protein